DDGRTDERCRGGGRLVARLGDDQGAAGGGERDHGVVQREARARVDREVLGLQPLERGGGGDQLAGLRVLVAIPSPCGFGQGGERALGWPVGGLVGLALPRL